MLRAVKNMQNNTFSKELFIVIIVLFFAVGVIPNISGDVGNDGEYFINSDSKLVSQLDADWWLMFHHDMNHSGHSTASSPDTNIVTWTYTTGDWVWSSPAVVNRIAYIGSDDGIVYAFKSNYPPEKPIITGPMSGKVGTEYTYTFNTVDPDGNNVYYYIKWGDGHVEIWDGPHASGENVIIAHTYTREDTFTIEVKAKDPSGAESDWTEFTVKMPRDKATNNVLFWRLLERFPLLERFLISIRGLV